jgi:hypothetical protein
MELSHRCHRKFRTHWFSERSVCPPSFRWRVYLWVVPGDPERVVRTSLTIGGLDHGERTYPRGWHQMSRLMRRFRPCDFDVVSKVLFRGYLHMTQDRGSQQDLFLVGTGSTDSRDWTFNDFLAKHDRDGWPHANCPIPHSCADAPLTDRRFDYASIAAGAGASWGCLTTLGFASFGIGPEIASAWRPLSYAANYCSSASQRFFPPRFLWRCMVAPLAA